MRFKQNILFLASAFLALALLSAAGCKLEEPAPTPVSPPETPTGLSIVAATEDSISLSWNPSAGATSYQVFRDVAATGSIGTVVYDGADTSTADSGLATASRFYYRVRAGNTVGHSDLSAAVSGWTIFPQISHRSESGNFTLDINLGNSAFDIYFVFTNPSLGAASSIPQVSALSGQQVSRAITQELKPEVQALPTMPGEGIRGKPGIDEFNRQPPPLLRSVHAAQALLPGPQKPLLDSVGSKHVFLNDSASSSIPSTCRLVLSGINVASGNPRTLAIWVADELWEVAGSPEVPKKVTQAMVDLLGAKFLNAGLSNDIYDWVSNIFGQEWGATPYSNLITPDDSITILLYDIDADRSTTGGVIGYFWAKDNFVNDPLDPILKYSNERVMFYLDGVMYATEEGPSWDFTDFWPQTLVSALAHEFQHMINFYQKTVLQTGGTGLDTWINEMLSLATEDCLSWLLQVSGPRGVAYGDGSGGPVNNLSGRLPLYNATNYLSLTNWLQDLRSYSMCYAFGAYLLRNFGGVRILHDIVYNSETDYQSIENALAQGGYTESFSELLKKWGAADILSDEPQSPIGYRYNSGQFFASSQGGTTYNLGSINLFNYKYGSLTGPLIYVTSPVGSTNPYSTSNLLFAAGQGLTGMQSWYIELPPGMYLTVVRK